MRSLLLLPFSKISLAFSSGLDRFPSSQVSLQPSTALWRARRICPAPPSASRRTVSQCAGHGQPRQDELPTRLAPWQTRTVRLCRCISGRHALRSPSPDLADSGGISHELAARTSSHIAHQPLFAALRPAPLLRS